MNKAVNLCTMASDFNPTPEQLELIMNAAPVRSATEGMPRMDLSREEICMMLHMHDIRLRQLELDFYGE